MPTLIEVPLDASMSMENNDELAGSQNEQETFMNDSTRLLDETFLDNESHGSQHNHNIAPDKEDKRDGSISYIDNDETILGDVTTLNDEMILDSLYKAQSGKGTNEGVTLLEYEKPKAAIRTKGPKEDHYTRKFERFVSHVIADFRRNHPDKLRDYRSLSPSEKEREQERINALLTRLGVSTTTVQHCRARLDPESRVALAETSGESSATQLASAHTDSLTEQSIKESFVLSPQENDSSGTLISSEKVDADIHECNQSSQLLSPESEIDNLAARMNQSMFFMSPSADAATSPARASQPPTDSDSSASSVELVRRNKSRRSSPSSQLYESPTITTNRSKRLASTSGKRGSDLSRMKINDESFVSFDANVARDYKMIASPSQLLCSSIKSPESPLFHASQSPIHDDFSSAENSRVEVQPSRLEVFEDQHSPNDTLQSNDDTTNYRRKVRWNEESFLQEIPANIHLKQGAPFRMKPLVVGRPERPGADNSGRRRQINLASIPDPLQSYEGTLRKKMKAAYAWMKVRDTLSDNGGTVNGGLLFSMSERHIFDVTMKLCIKHPSNHNLSDMIDEVLRGGTLIVARSKEELEEWQSSLREGTCFSVLNHATMPLEERKRTSTANRCAGYDVVLTTYDTLKSKDITTPLDHNGHVVHEKIGYQDGWYSARSSGSDAPGRCEQLCVLHQINWRRVIFVDVLGRKSFLVKEGTARAVASVALCTSSR